LIKPDFEKWKPLKPRNQLLMAIEHGFAEKPVEVEVEKKDKDVTGIDNIVNNFYFLFFKRYFFYYMSF
jgi:hypothetical protein